MKNLYFWLFCFLIIFLPSYVLAQETVADTFKNKLHTQYIIQKFDGNVYVGKIIYQDPRMIQLEVKKIGTIYIPRNDIEIIKEMNKQDIATLNSFTPQQIFSTRYIITSSMLPFQKHDNYGLWNWYGPDLHRAAKANLDFSIMSTWIGLPIIGNVKYGIELGEKTSIGFGSLLGWGTWGYPDCSAAFPYTSFSVGDLNANLTCTAGYGIMAIYGVSEQRSLFSLAAMKSVGKRISLVFDSFVLPASSPNSTIPNFAIFIPGIRMITDSRSAFQFGFGGIFLDWTFVPAPFPFMQWFRKI